MKQDRFGGKSQNSFVNIFVQQNLSTKHLLVNVKQEAQRNKTISGCSDVQCIFNFSFFIAMKNVHGVILTKFLDKNRLFLPQTGCALVNVARGCCQNCRKII